MKKFTAIILLWFPFSLAAIISIPVLLYGIIAENEEVWKPVGRAMDKLLAAILGYSGNHTLSAELGASHDMPLLRRFLDMIEPEHCHKAAIAEKLI